MKTVFYKCPHCGNVVMMMVDSGVVPVCCGDPMKRLDPHSFDGAREKHVPAVTRTEHGALEIKVGEVPHPMTPEHHICFIAVETANGIKVCHLDPEKPAEVVIRTDCCEVTAVYEYCNLHGLWVTTDIPAK